MNLPGAKTPASPAIDVARAACAFDGTAIGFEGLDLAMRMGASVQDCAALAASFGASSLLARCLDSGADPLAQSLPLHERERCASLWSDQKSFAPTLLTRAILAGSSACCSVLADRGAELLNDPTAAALLVKLPNDGIARWPCVAAALAASAPDPASASLVALALLPAASRQFDAASLDMAAGAGEALSVIDRLISLGAPLGRALAGGDSPLDSFFDSALPAVASSGSDPAAAKALSLLCAFSSRADPGAAPRRLASCLRAFAKSGGGEGSSFPESAGAAALRKACLVFARACPPSHPAAAAILGAALEGIDAPRLLREPGGQASFPIGATAFRASRKSLAWLGEGSSSWAAPDAAGLARARALMASALASSARFFSTSAAAERAPSGHRPQLWLAWAASARAAPWPAAPGAGLPLMAAQTARDSDSRLGEAFARMAPTASALADDRLDPEQRKALMEAIDIAGSAGAAPASAPRRRI